MCVIKRKLKFGNYKNCLEESELENKINHLEKSAIDINRIKENHKKIIKKQYINIKNITKI